ncbi:MAG TPA: alpha/beta fold hydrolase [Aridibacter sp.]|nr:alpha/beta fold hydrolase [Aridibacter sp.]
MPEDHSNPQGRKIEIAYAVVSARKGKAEEAVIYFSGGPGGGSLRAGFINFLGNDPLAEIRDVIIFDQRGIQHSSALPDIGKGVYEAMAADTDMEGERKMIAKVLHDFRKKAEKRGIDLGAYNSFQNARDVAELMKKLRYDKYNLFGVSYGTRLARIIQDLYPEMLNAVILDSPNLMTDDFLIDRMKSYSSAAEKTFRACERDAKCRAAHPELEKEYRSVIAKLKSEPVAVKYDGGTFVINSQDAVYFLRRQLYRTDALERFPALLHAFEDNDPKILKAVVEAELADVDDGSFNTSMFLAVSAYESMDRANTPEAIGKLYGELPHFPDRLAFFTNLYIEGIDWHGKSVSAADRVFKMSSVPTIIFVNQYDPVTPPENGRFFQQKLERSHLFVIDEGGHGGGNFACKTGMMNDFMNDTSKKPDASCMKLYID